MIRVNQLRAKIMERGLTIKAVSEKMGVDRSTLYRKMQAGYRSGGFTVGDVQILASILELTPKELTEIFFSGGVA